MVYIFVIFFILELIVVAMLCYGICLLDKKVVALSENFKVNRHTLKFKLRTAYSSANALKIWMKCKKRTMEEKRRKLIRKVLKSVLVSIALFFFQKTIFRKKILFIELM